MFSIVAVIIIVTYHYLTHGWGNVYVCVSIYILNKSLVPAILSFFGFGPCTFFCLALVHALCKNFVIGPSVIFKLNKLLKLMVCHVDQLFHDTWDGKSPNFQN